MAVQAFTCLKQFMTVLNIHENWIQDSLNNILHGRSLKYWALPKAIISYHSIKLNAPPYQAWSKFTDGIIRPL